MTVNPKKLRPYDEPPRERRKLIPDAPDSAATGFMVAAALWLALATAIGLVAIAVRLVPFEVSTPIGIFDLDFSFNERVVEHAFVDATVFGWLSNAGFAAIAFITPRLTGRRLAMEPVLMLAVALWNLALLGGIALLYILPLGPHAPLADLPWFVNGGLATAALLVAVSFFVTAGSSLRSGYVSIWFAAVAVLALLGLTGLMAAIGLIELVVSLPDLAVALASAFVERALMTMWLLGMAYATLYYVVPQATGQPLASGGLAMLAWLTWLVLAPLSALGVLTDTSVPFFVTTLGATGTMLLLLPAALTLLNLIMSMQGRWTLLFSTGTIAFAAVAIAFLLATSLLEALHALRPVYGLVGGTEWETGVFLWAAYGSFTLAALALTEHALPRVLRRDWGGGFLSGAQLWLVFVGVTAAGLALMGGGMAQGTAVSTGATPEDVQAALLGYRAVALAGFGLVALGGLAMLLNLFLMYTSAEPIDHVISGQPAPAAAGH